VRLGQLTGTGTPNPLAKWGAYGVDLGASTEYQATWRRPSRLFIFSGDVALDELTKYDEYADPERYPPWDSDLVAYTGDTTNPPESFPFQVVSDPGLAQPPEQGPYHPFTVEKLGILGKDEGPTGAFSYDGRAYVFIVAAGPESYLVSSAQPDQPATFTLHFKFASRYFWQVAPVVVSNAKHPGLPEQSGDGLVMIGHGGYPENMHLAWMPLVPGRFPRREKVLFYAGSRRVAGFPHSVWSPLEEDAVGLFTPPPPRGYTAVSLAWVPDPQRWILLYSLARPPGETDSPRSPRGPIVARVAADLTAWSDEIKLVTPPLADFPWDDQVSWAYGAFIIHRFTEWDPAKSQVRICYLLSLFAPYQLQLMESWIGLPDVPLWRRVVQMFIQFLTRAVLKVGP